MKIVGYNAAGPIAAHDSLLDLEAPKPMAQGCDLLVQVRAVSVNPVDTKVRANAAPIPAPRVLGWDAAGVVVAIGPDVTLFEVGDEVFYAGAIDRPGSNAEFQLVDERIVGRKPTSLDFAGAAALPLTSITAWELLFDRLKVQMGKPADAGAILILGADLSLQQPFLGFQVRANQRHHAAKVYVITPNAVREDPSATRAVRAAGAQILDELAQMRDALAAEPELVIAFDDNIKGSSVRELVAFGDSLGIPVRYCCLVDYSNSRGAMDMGLLPDLLPGYVPAQPAGMTAEEMIAAPDLDVMWVVGSNPLEGAKKTWRKAFIVVQEMFLTETAQLADVVLPAASAYEKNGTVTNVCGEVQRLKKALNTMGAKPDLEIMGLIGREMGLAKVLGPWFAEQVFEEIRANVHGYNVSMPIIETGGAAQTAPVNGPINVVSRPDLIQSAHDTLFTSGNLGKYSKILNSVLERRMGAAPEASIAREGSAS